MRFLSKFCNEGEILPTGYGVAWHDWQCNRAVCYPIPLNVVVGIARAFYFWLRYDYRKSPIFGAEAYYQGYRDREFALTGTNREKRT